LKTLCSTNIQTKKAPNIKNFLSNKIKDKLEEKENTESKPTDENKVTKSKEEVHSIVNRLYYSRHRKLNKQINNNHRSSNHYPEE